MARKLQHVGTGGGNAYRRLLSEFGFTNRSSIVNVMKRLEYKITPQELKKFGHDDKIKLSAEGLVEGVEEAASIEKAFYILTQQKKNGLEIFLELSGNFSVEDILDILSENGIKIQIQGENAQNLSALDIARIKRRDLMVGDKETGEGDLEK